MSGPVFREAAREDVPAVVALLADDILGRDRERGEADAYLTAFDRMRQEAANRIVLAEQAGEIAGCYQITFISGLSLSAARRAQIEGLRVAASHRGRGLGEAMIRDAEARARAAGCALMQFTTNRTRADAHRFYERLGFTPSHIGYKKPL